MALDRMPAATQAEWLAFDLAREGVIPKRPHDPDEKPPDDLTPEQRFHWVMERMQ